MSQREKERAGVGGDEKQTKKGMERKRERDGEKKSLCVCVREKAGQKYKRIWWRGEKS